MQDEIDTAKPINEMNFVELAGEYTYLSDLFFDSVELGLSTPRQNIYKRLLYVRARLEEFHQIH